MKQICMFLITLALLTSCGVDQKKYDAQVAKVDSLTKVNAEIRMNSKVISIVRQKFLQILSRTMKNNNTLRSKRILIYCKNIIQNHLNMNLRKAYIHNL